MQVTPSAASAATSAASTGYAPVSSPSATSPYPKRSNQSDIGRSVAQPGLNRPAAGHHPRVAVIPDLARLVADAGGLDAPRERSAQLRSLLAAELDRGAKELVLPRSGYGAPVVVAAAPVDSAIVAVAPVDRSLRADPHSTGERGWLLVAALVGALVEAAGSGRLEAGEFGRSLALRLEADPSAAELVPVAFDEHVRAVDRLRARALALPGHVLADAGGFADPIGAAHPLRVALQVARLGGRPADPDSVAEHEEAILVRLEGGERVARPHDDPQPSRRVARRILQRLHGMGKWGGYHTEFAHLARGFAGNDRALAEAVGERLLAAGMLVEKPSVGQRHVFLNPRRAGDIHALIDRGVVPPDLELP
jgi:hypothetical protein